MEKNTREARKYRNARLSAEQGISLKKSAPIRACLVFPNTYHTGMSNLAVHSLYSTLNSRVDCVCERGFCDEPLIGHSFESGSRLDAFHLIAFSISFELDYPNVLRSLIAAHIPLRSRERDESHPLIIAGGPCIFSNPEPLADCFDLCVIGEGEEVVHEILDVLSSAQSHGRDRRTTLRLLSEIDGVYIPSLFDPVYGEGGELTGMDSREHIALPINARTVEDLDKYPCRSVIITPKTEFSNMFLIEIGRGCRRGCRFCLACHTYLRRNRSLDSLKGQILEAKGLTDRVGLVTSDLADYRQHRQLISFLLNEGFGFSASSMRADAITEDVLAGMKAGGQRTLTLAPEVASDNLAVYIGKKITVDTLHRVVNMALDQSISNFRLYFMIGFPGEEDTDVESIVDLAARIQQAMRIAAKGLKQIGRLTISVNPFVPKPFTPLEEAPFEDSTVLSRRIGILRTGLGRIGNTRLVAESPRMAMLQCIFARGDRRVLLLAETLAGGTTPAQAIRFFGEGARRYLRPRVESSGMRPWHTIRPPRMNRRTNTGEN